MHDLRIQNLVLRLNNLAEQRKELFDQLWVNEEAAQGMRQELLQLLEEVNVEQDKEAV